MLDMGFERDVRTIVGMTPTSRRTVMFTATWPDSVRELASDFLRDPIRVNVGSEALSANHRVTQVDTHTHTHTHTHIQHGRTRARALSSPGVPQRE